VVDRWEVVAACIMSVAACLFMLADDLKADSWMVWWDAAIAVYWVVSIFRVFFCGLKA